MVMAMEMVIQIDKQGRLVLPKEIREKYHLDQGSEIILIPQDEGVLLKPKKSKLSLAGIFQKATPFDPDKVIALDIANYDEEDVW